MHYFPGIFLESISGPFKYHNSGIWVALPLLENNGIIMSNNIISKPNMEMKRDLIILSCWVTATPPPLPPPGKIPFGFQWVWAAVLQPIYNK